MSSILIVDDEENIRLLYEKELSAEGYQVHTAATVEQAQDAFRNTSPDLVVLDLKLTAENGGLEILRWMREADRSIPIVINTAYPAYKADFSSWLADAYVVKSGNLEELKKTIKSLLNNK